METGVKLAEEQLNYKRWDWFWRIIGWLLGLITWCVLSAALYFITAFFVWDPRWIIWCETSILTRIWAFVLCSMSIGCLAVVINAFKEY